MTPPLICLTIIEKGADRMTHKHGVVIVGGSIAGYNVAQRLRKEGYEESITMIEEKGALPYDRSKLSKDWMGDTDKIEPPLFQGEQYFKEQEINVQLNTQVTEIVPEEKIVITNEKQKIPYDTLVIATGSSLRKLDVPGADADGVFYLRDYEDALEIKEWAKEVKNLAIVGAGFIGLEMAATFSQLGLNVTVIEFSDYPLGRILGQEASEYFMKMHENHGVKFITGAGADAFKTDNDGKVTAVVTTTGEEVACEMAIVGVGVTPNLAIDYPDLEIDGGIVVNEYGETSIDDIYAIGDIAVWPYKDEMIHVEHWEHAYNHGQTIARNIMNPKSRSYTVRPYFWTDQYDQTFERLGHAMSWDRIITRGSLKDKEFTLAYVDEENYPLAIFFANNGDKRKEVSKFMNRNEPINEERFKNMDNPL